MIIHAVVTSNNDINHILHLLHDTGLGALGSLSNSLSRALDTLAGSTSGASGRSTCSTRGTDSRSTSGASGAGGGDCGSRSLMLHRLGGLGQDAADVAELRVVVSVGINLVVAVVTDEGDEILDGAGATVVNGGVLCASGVELDGGETGDFFGDIVEGCIDCGDGYLGIEWGEEATELFVLGCETDD
jgi:hypothetical protein